MKTVNYFSPHEFSSSFRKSIPPRTSWTPSWTSSKSATRNDPSPNASPSSYAKDRSLSRDTILVWESLIWSLNVLEFDCTCLINDKKTPFSPSRLSFPRTSSCSISISFLSSATSWSYTTTGKGQIEVKFIRVLELFIFSMIFDFEKANCTATTTTSTSDTSCTANANDNTGGFRKKENFKKRNRSIYNWLYHLLR